MSLDVPKFADDAMGAHHARLRDEANAPEAEIEARPPTKKTQIIAIYGKGASASPSRWRTSAT